MVFEGRTLYRIIALKNFSDVEAGDLGGWVSGIDNLSQEGNCWIYDEAKCMGNARMFDNSKMFNNSKMHGNSTMYNDSRMYDCSVMYNNSTMYGHSIMYDHSIMHDHSEMHDNAVMHDHSEMYDNARMFDNSEMGGHSEMYGDSILKAEEKLYGELISKVDKFIDISNPKGEMVTGVLKDGEVLFNVGNLSEINKEEFLDILYNGDKIIEESSSRKEYLKIIDMIVLHLLG